MAARSSLVLRIVLVLGVLVALGFVGLRWLRPTAEVAAVVRGTAVNQVPGSVAVTATFFMDVKTEASGRVQSSELDEGKLFKVGDPLVQIDPTDLDLQIEKLKSDYAIARRRIEIGSGMAVRLEVAREEIENVERLYELGQYSESGLKQRRRDLANLEREQQHEKVNQEATLADYENQLKLRQREREKMTVRAPFEGVVAEVFVRPGELVGSGSPVARLIATGRTVVARISEENFAGIEIGQRASVRFLGYGDHLFRATVAKKLPTAEEATQRYQVYLDVEIEQEALVPGTTGEVSIVVAERPDALIIPRRALFGDSVYRVNDGRVELRKVQVGYTSLNSVEVLSGLDEGDLVITERLDTFREGDRVRVLRDA